MAASLEDLLNESSKRFSETGEVTREAPPQETGIPEVVEPTDTLPVLEEEPPAEIPQTEPVELPSVEDLLNAQGGDEEAAEMPPSPTPMERFRYNKKLINEAKEKQDAQLRDFAINKFLIGLRQFSLKFPDTYSKNIDSFSTDPVAGILNATVQHAPLMQFINPEEKKYFDGGGINLLVKEFYANVLGTPIPEDLPDNAWTAAAEEAATTGNILSIIRRGAALQVKEFPRVIGKMKKVKRFAKQVPQFGKKVIKGLAQAHIKSPILVGTAEMVGAMTAGVIGAEFERTHPNHPVTKFLLSSAGGGLVTLAAPRKVWEAVSGLWSMGKSATVGGKAKEGFKRRLSEGIEDEKQEIIDQLEVSDQTYKDGTPIAKQEDLKELRGVSVPTQQSGSALLARIYQAIVDQSSKLQHAQQVQFEQYNDAIQTALRSIGGDPVYTRQTLLNQQEEFKRALDILVENSRMIFTSRVKASLDEGVEMTLKQANDAAKKEVDAIIKVAFGQEEDLYLNIDFKTLFKLDTPHVQLQNILDRRAVNSRPGDLPGYVTKAFGSWVKLSKKEIQALKKKGIPVPPKQRRWEPGNLKNKTNTLELTEIRSRMLEDARIASAAGRSNKARILNLMAESVRHSYGETATKASKETEHKIKLANQFSSDLHDMISRGKLAPMLARTAKGADKFGADDFLDKALWTKSGSKRAGILQALHDEPGQFGNPAHLRVALDNWIRGEFARKFIKNGDVFDAAGAKKYMEANRETFEMYDELGADLLEVIKTGNTAKLFVSRVDDLGKRLGDPNISKATLFIEKPPMEAFDSIRYTQDIGNNNVEKQITLLLNQVKKDKSGKALLGFQGAFAKYIMDLSSSGQATINATGIFTDGKSMKIIMNEPAIRVMMFKILTPHQRQKLEFIQEAALRLDISRRATVPPEGVLGSQGEPANLMRIFVKIAGAQAGRKVGEFTGGGTIQAPGFMSAHFEKFLRSNIKDPISLIMHQAFMADDPRVLALLFKEIKSEKEMKEASIAIGSWFNALVYNSGAKYFDEEE